LRSLEEFRKNPHVKIPPKSPCANFQRLGIFMRTLRMLKNHWTTLKLFCMLIEKSGWMQCMKRWSHLRRTIVEMLFGCPLAKGLLSELDL
jgi:hypothetical protein